MTPSERPESTAIHGRGTGWNPKNRFEELAYQPDPEELASEGAALPTRYFKDASRSFLVRNDSPDVGFEWSANPYRGCEHGCVYCYARPTHEYAGFSAGLDFESKILVKEDAPELLRKELARPRWVPQVVALSGVTDCYQPIERALRLTRRCLEVFAAFRNPVAVITKGALVARDADVLAELARHGAAVVNVSVTSLDDGLASVLEPRAARPRKRLEAIAALAAAGVPVGVMVAPVISGLNDHEIPAILKEARAAGARSASYVVLRLPHAVKELFETWLHDHFPDRAAKVLNRVRAMRGGALYDARFGARMRGEGIFADEIAALFRVARARAGFGAERVELSAAAFRPPGPVQGSLFPA